MPDFHTICQANEIPEGEARTFVVNDVTVGVFHIDGQFFALDNRFPHAGALLADGIIESDTVRCRIHHWRFCIRDGTYLDEDRLRYNVRTFPVRVVGEDVRVEM